MKDFLEKYNIGYTVDPDSPEELVDLLIRLSDNDNELLEMKQKAKEIAAKEFDKNILADKMLKTVIAAISK